MYLPPVISLERCTADVNRAQINYATEHKKGYLSPATPLPQSRTRPLCISPAPCTMPICIECRYSVPQLYHTSTSAKASKKSSGASSNTSTSASHAAGPAGTSGTHSSNGVPPAAVPTQAESSQRRKAHDADADAQASARRTPAGADVRLTQCPRCKRFADKYVEHDFVVLFIDLVLVKPQV